MCIFYVYIWRPPAKMKAWALRQETHAPAAIAERRLTRADHRFMHAWVCVHEVSRDRHRGVIGTVRNIPVDFKKTC